MPSSFEQVAEMNKAFNNRKGDYNDIDYEKLRRQVANVLDEVAEFMNAWKVGDRIGMRDALCDIQVFAMGGQHMMGVDGDADMEAVVAGVMTRFVKNYEDLQDTLDKHAKKGVTKVYLEGEFPRVIVKSAEDQPDAPKGKFLKSASYKDTVFPDVKP